MAIKKEGRVGQERLKRRNEKDPPHLQQRERFLGQRSPKKISKRARPRSRSTCHPLRQWRVLMLHRQQQREQVGPRAVRCTSKETNHRPNNAGSNHSEAPRTPAYAEKQCPPLLWDKGGFPFLLSLRACPAILAAMRPSTLEHHCRTTTTTQKPPLLRRSNHHRRITVGCRNNEVH